MHNRQASPYVKMSTIITFDLKELRKLVNDKNSCVVEKKVTQNLALQPWCLGNPKESVKTLLDYKIGKFDKEFNGILLSYKNLCILQNVGSIRNDNADIHFQVQADYFIFTPYVGATLKGVVNKKSSTHLGILVHRVFNVVIPRPTEEPGNKWIGEGIEEGQQVVFQIVVLDLFGALPYIRGQLDERWLKQFPDDDNEVEEYSNESISVSYINFDKTKPHTQKQSKDHGKSCVDQICDMSPERKPENGDLSSTKCGKKDNVAVIDKLKIKTKSTDSDNQTDKEEVSIRQSKKRKKKI
ncbi:hypothetical protein evm_014193 [Chilo suppressalis]|nr:hypothetical protein evm_014193 [Chilo suppressalis]